VPSCRRLGRSDLVAASMVAVVLNKVEARRLFNRSRLASAPKHRACRLHCISCFTQLMKVARFCLTSLGLPCLLKKWVMSSVKVACSFSCEITSMTSL